MKLLLDENLSRRLIPFLSNDYPESSQIALLGMESADDDAVWEYARDHGYVIVTRDSDYYDMSLIRGQPPKIIWLRTGNQSKAGVVKVLLDHREWIEQALTVEGKACIEIY